MLSTVLDHTRALVRSYRWRWLDSSDNTEDIPIPDLIGPLRYDAIALRDLVRFYERHQAMAANDFQRFLAEARQLRYFPWKYWSHMIRDPQETRDPVAFARVWAEKIRQAVDVWESMKQRGFDRAFPIEVRITGRLLPTSSGKQVSARYILGDGSHRIACLMELGYTSLPCDHYRVRWYRRLRPNDSTWLLTRRGLLPAEEYFAFLSMVYGAPRVHAERRSFLADIGSRLPNQIDEVRRIVKIDGFSGE